MTETFSKTIWLGRVSLSENCDSPASCNGSLFFEDGKPLHLYDWMNVEFDLWTSDTCAVMSWSVKIIGADCDANPGWFDVCRIKQTPGKYRQLLVVNPLSTDTTDCYHTVAKSK